MAKIIKFLKADRWKILLVLIFTFAQAMSSLYLPSLMSNIVNIGVTSGDTNYILTTGAIMLAVAFAGVLFQVTGRFISSRVSARFSQNIRQKVFTKVEEFSLAEFDKFSTASLITRCTNDVNQIQHFLDMTLRMAISAPMMAIGGIIMAIRYGQSLSWILIISCSAIVGIMILNFSITVPKFKLVQKNLDQLNLITRENLSGLRVIRAFNTQDVQEGKFDDVNKDVTNLHLSIGRIMAALNPLTMVVMNATTIAALWLGTGLIQSQTILVGDLMAFIQYMMQIMFSFQMLSMSFMIIPRAMVSINRINEVLDMQPQIQDPKIEDYSEPENVGVVEFNNVTFTYPNAVEPALCDISFTARPGELTAVIGSTGSGKTTLANLIPRLYDPTKGSIFEDGRDIRELKQKDLRKRIGYVPQRATLFAGDIYTNISFDRDITSQQVEESAEIAQATNFIQEKEEGFDHYIAQGGTNISGGQKQRLSIARALASSPSIYIFDDSFSSLDFQTEARLRTSLIPKIKNAAVILITQRVSTIMNAEQIIVLDAGKMVGIGKHKDLLKNCVVYREIASSQLSKEELA